MRSLVALAFVVGLIQSVSAEESKDKELACGENAQMEKILNEKGYSHLFDMTSSKGVVQSFWAGGRSMVITAQNPEKKGISCLLEQSEAVTYNPVTITEIYNAFQKSQKGI